MNSNTYILAQKKSHHHAIKNNNKKHISWEIASQSIFKGKGIFKFLFSKFLYLAMLGRKSNIFFYCSRCELLKLLTLLLPSYIKRVKASTPKHC